MLHHSAKRKLGRVRKQHTALLRLLANSLILHGKIETTEAKAKELRPFIEKLITRGKKSSLANQRLLITRLGGNKIGVRKLVTDIVPKFKDRKGGYTRITKRKSASGRQRAFIEFVE